MLATLLSTLQALSNEILTAILKGLCIIIHILQRRKWKFREVKYARIRAQQINGKIKKQTQKVWREEGDRVVLESGDWGLNLALWFMGRVISANSLILPGLLFLHLKDEEKKQISQDYVGVRWEMSSVWYIVGAQDELGTIAVIRNIPGSCKHLKVASEEDTRKEDMMER